MGPSAVALAALALCLGAGAGPGPAAAPAAAEPEAALAADDECAAGGGGCALAALQLRGRGERGLAATSGGGQALGGAIRWRNHPGKCLDVTAGEVRDGAHIQVWDCTAGNANQQFAWSPGTSSVRWAAHPEYCLDVRDHGDFNGNYVQLWRCSEWNADQRFDVPVSGEGRIKWHNFPAKCLDVRDHSTANGAALQIWDCSAGDSDQDFLLSGASPGLGPAPSPQPPPPPEPSPQPGTAGAAYDIIVVGGGLVGSAVAAGLAERLPQRRVLLVEAGGASQRSVGGRDGPASWDGALWDGWPGFEGTGLMKYDVPGNYGSLQCWARDCDTSWGQLVPEFQCRILGGCGVMNGALMQLPSEENFEEWPMGWRFSDLSPYYQAAQSMYTITSTPSVDGRHYLDNTGADFVHKLMTSHGFRLVDSLRKTPNTMSVPHVSAKGGIRESTTSLLLPKALERRNFEMKLHTEALKVLYDADGVATGLSVQTAGGGHEELKLAAGGALVVSAGAMNTPRLLLASGLTAGGQVGQHLTDHTLRSMIYRVSKTYGSSLQAFHIKPFPESNVTSLYVREHTGPLTQFGPTLTLFIRDPSTPGGPDVYDVEAWVNPESKGGEVHLSAVLMRPTCPSGLVYYSGGRLRQSGNLNLACDRDRQTLDFAINELDRWMATRGASRTYTSQPEAMNHFVGTCALGRCVDPSSLRLHGTRNVAVADASLLPTQVWGHPALTLTAAALKATDLLAAWF